MGEPLPPAMIHAILAAVAFLFWEAGVSLFSLRLLRRWTMVANAELLLYVLSVNVICSSTIAGVLCFLKLNFTALYLTAATMLLAIAVIRRDQRAKPRASRTALLILMAAPLCLLVLRPVEDVDSLNHLHYMLDWMANRATPYLFATHYVAFWELGYLPILALTRSDWFLWAISLKAVVLAGCAVYLVGRELGLPEPLAACTTFSSLALQFFWIGPSGATTIKNDMIHAAGIVLLALALVRRSNYLLPAIFGVVFACVKFSGVFIAALAAILLICRAGARLRAFLAGAAIFLLTSGHYYIKNLIQYHNPFYPFQLNLPAIHLPGLADLSSTSILSNLRDPRLWQAFFFPRGGLSPAGLLFPVVLLAVLTVVPAVAVRTRKILPLFILFTWFIYFRSFFGAGAFPGDLTYVRTDLSSMRYAEGALCLTEVFLVQLLYSSGTPAVFVYALIAIQAISRLAILYLKIHLDTTIAAGFILAWLVVALAARRFWRLSPAVAILSLFAAPWMLEFKRGDWLVHWKDVYSRVRPGPASNIFLVADEDKTSYFAGHFPLAGDWLQNHIQVGTEVELHRLLQGNAPPDYIAELIGAHIRPESSEFATLAAQTAPSGYAITELGDREILLNRLKNRLKPVPPPLNADHDFHLARESRSLGDWEISIAAGHYKWEQGTDASGPFLRITAMNDARWLVLVGRFPPTVRQGSPVTLRGQVRCHAHAPCSLQLIEAYTGGKRTATERWGTAQDAWEELKLARRLHGQNDSSYYALGITGAKTGDSFDVKDLSLLSGFYP